MEQPTQEQIKELWEWCGIKQSVYGHELAWFLNNEWPPLKRLPPIDLNNLFKYAVPKLQDKGNNVELYAYEHKGYMATVYKDSFSQRGSDGFDPFLEPVSQIKDDDPALALFWAIWEVKCSP